MNPQGVLEPLEALAPLQDAPAAGPRWRALPWPARVLDAVAAYLPLLVMALLALGSWWLVKNTPLPQAAREPAPARHLNVVQSSKYLRICSSWMRMHLPNISSAGSSKPM